MGIENSEQSSEFSGFFGEVERMITGILGDDQPERGGNDRHRKLGPSAHSHQYQTTDQSPKRTWAGSDSGLSKVHNGNEHWTMRISSLKQEEVKEPLNRTQKWNDELVLKESRTYNELTFRNQAERFTTGGSVSQRNLIDNGGFRKHEKLAGIGLLIEAFPGKGMVVVKNVMPGGPADLDGRIQANDLLLDVDNIDVTNMPGSAINELIRGPLDSTLSLRLVRAKGNTRYDVIMKRSYHINLNVGLNNHGANSTAPVDIVQQPRFNSYQTLPLKTSSQDTSTPHIKNQHTSSRSQGSENPSDSMIVPFMKHNQIQEKSNRLHSDRTAGIGLGINYDELMNAVIVQSIAPGGPADLSGQVKKEDLLLEVDAMSIRGLNMSEVKNLILGPNGSPISLTLIENGTGRKYSVSMIRKAGSVVQQAHGLNVGKTVSRPLSQHVPQKSTIQSPPSMPQRKSSMRADQPQPLQAVSRGQCGVGLAIDANLTVGLPRVIDIHPQGAAASQGIIQLHDQLLEVDGQDASMLNAKGITSLVLGEQGTSVSLKLIRPSQVGPDMIYIVNLVRQSFGPETKIASGTQSHSVDIEGQENFRKFGRSEQLLESIKESPGEQQQHALEQMSIEERSIHYNLQRRRTHASARNNSSMATDGSITTSTPIDLSNYNFDADRFQREAGRNLSEKIGTMPSDVPT